MVAGQTPPKLVLIDPSGARTQLPIAKTPFTIGRLNENDVLLRDSRISRHHAVIVLENGHYLIQDQNSRHGTFVNGVRVEGRRELRPNDRIDFGVPDSPSLIFVTEEESLEDRLHHVDTPPSPGAVSQQLRKLNLFLEVGRTLHAGLALDDVLTLVVDTCLEITGSDRAFLLLPDAGGRLECRIGRDRNKSTLTCEEADLSYPAIQQVLERGREVLVDHPRPVHHLIGGEAHQAPQPAILCLPLHRAPSVTSLDTTEAGLPGSILGVIYLDRQKSAQPLVKLDQQILRSLAQEAATLIENARLFTAARDKERLDQELAIARDIQQALLPKRFREYETFRVVGVNIPSEQVGGDCYDVIELADGRHAFVVSDVSGKGVSAALLTSMLQGALAAMVEAGQPLGVAARLLNRRLRQHTGLNKFATIFCGLLEPSGRFQYVNAGHVPGLRVPRAGEIDLLRAESLPLGLFEEDDYPAPELALQPGDTLVLSTDGFMDAQNPEGEFYGFERLRQAVERLRGASAEELADALLGDVREFSRGTPPGDDMTLLVVRYEGKD